MANELKPKRVYYTIQEIAAEWRVSKDTVRRIFQQEAGVLFVGSKVNNTSRGRAKIRIPEEVYRRVQAKLEAVRL